MLAELSGVIEPLVSTSGRATSVHTSSPSIPSSGRSSSISSSSSESP
uniref:Uncharacterized protein n=1 Tax=Amphimedon queenslandica TaxID=400682 RepID=A0A1X7UMQ7_AMPQE